MSKPFNHVGHLTIGSQRADVVYEILPQRFHNQHYDASPALTARLGDIQVSIVLDQWPTRKRMPCIEEVIGSAWQHPFGPDAEHELRDRLVEALANDKVRVAA